MRTSWKVAAFAALLIGNACVLADDVVEEEETVGPGGVVETCGSGDGLNPCRDADGETWKHADDPDYIKVDSTQQLEQSSAAIRAENPKELEKTIQQIEDDEQH
jgi:hypothetical protein